MTDLLSAADRVKTIVQKADRYLDLTQQQLDTLLTYQFTTPTGPKPGFMYKREYWRIPGEDDLWCGPNESHVRVAIGGQRPKKNSNGTFTPALYDGPLESTWFVFTCEADPRDRMYIIHRPKEARVIV